MSRVGTRSTVFRLSPAHGLALLAHAAASARRHRWTAIAVGLGLAAAAALAAVTCARTDRSPTSARTPTSAPAPGSVALREVDGGRNYYGQFAHGLPSDASYFPIGTWLMTALEQGQIDDDKEVGVNLYVGVAAPEDSDLGLLRASGQKALIQDDERTRFTGIGSETAGWLLADEIDMFEGPAACNGRLQTIKNGLPADGRAHYSNYGKGVLLWETDAEAACFVEAQQLVSSDLYWFTDPNQTHQECGTGADPNCPGMFGEPWLPEGERQMIYKEIRRASNYGYQVDRMRALDAMDGQRKPIWNFVEVGWPFAESAAQGGRAISAPELRAAVWHSIIAGARGILYFDHQANGPCDDRVLRRPYCYPENRAMVKSVNQQIKDLAPVLNAPFVDGLLTTTGPVRAMVKWHAGNLYLFAGSKENRSSTATFSLPCVGDATAVRLGEPGSLPIQGGSFNDSFPNGNTIHIYRIDGATCGLPAP